MMEQSAYLYDTLSFTEKVAHRPKGGEAADTLMLTDKMLTHIGRAVVINRIAFKDSVTTNIASSQQFGDTLLFTDSLVTYAPPQTVSDFLYVFDWLQLPVNTDLEDNLVFVDSISSVDSLGLYDLIAYSESLVVSKNRGAQSTDTLAFKEGMSQWFDNPWRV